MKSTIRKVPGWVSMVDTISSWRKITWSESGVAVISSKLGLVGDHVTVIPEMKVESDAQPTWRKVVGGQPSSMTGPTTFGFPTRTSSSVTTYLRIQVATRVSGNTSQYPVHTAGNFSQGANALARGG